MKDLPIVTVALDHEEDIVVARRRAKQIAQSLGFRTQDISRISTAVSEIARNALVYAGRGKAEFLFNRDGCDLVIRISDEGPGISDVDAILSGRYESKTGMGLGIVGARRLMDGFEIYSEPGAGVIVTLSKHLPDGAAPVTARTIAAIAKTLAGDPQDVYEDIRQQNQELLDTLHVLRDREEDLLRLNHELEDTNRGVVALYSELDQKARELRVADQMKSRFLSHVSHEFRTPLNAIMGLTALLLRRPEVAGSADATREIGLLRRSAEGLTEMVNDLLDLAKAESGKMEVRAAEVNVSELFATLRGMFRPLLTNEDVRLIIEEPHSVPPMRTDEDKLSQILRNFLSNALKFTEKGFVRLSARYEADTGCVEFRVEDTGIGIPPENISRLFEEFSQLHNPLQRRAKGTGLGLALCKRLAELLGGSVEVRSRVGEGSAFSVNLPAAYCAKTDAQTAASRKERTLGHKALIIDDEEVSRYLMRHLLAGKCEIHEAVGGPEGLEKIKKIRPDAVFLDLNMPDLDGFGVLEEMRADPSISSTPVVIVTALQPDAEMAAALAKRDIKVISKETLARAESITIDFGPPLSVSPNLPGE